MVLRASINYPIGGRRLASARMPGSGRLADAPVIQSSLVWPRVSAAEQNAINATCRKLYRFINRSTAAKRPKSAHDFR